MIKTNKTKQNLISQTKSLFQRKPRKSENFGRIAESKAKQFLINQQLEFITQNYFCRHGEIDLIMKEKNSNQLVFIEVRYRKNHHFGTALETINSYKLNRIKTAINHYIMTNNLGYIPCRIDVIGLQGNLESPLIDWRKNIIID